MAGKLELENPKQKVVKIARIQSENRFWCTPRKHITYYLYRWETKIEQAKNNVNLNEGMKAIYSWR